MPYSWVGDNPPSTHLNAYCLLNPEHALIGVGPYEMVQKQVVAHFMKEHPQENLMIQGQSFTMETAPLRCDLCNAIAEPPFWTRTIEPGKVLGDADGKWLVCDPCEQDLQAMRVGEIIRRARRVVQEHSPSISDNPELWRRAERSIREHAYAISEGTVTRDE